jgi:excisionase family DNA binding protein
MTKPALRDKIVLTPREAAALTGMSPGTIYVAIKTEQLVARRLGNRMIIMRPDLDEYLQTLPRWTCRKSVGETEGGDEKSLQHRHI